MISETTTEDSLLFGGYVFSAMLAEEDGTLHEGVCFKMEDFVVSALTFEELEFKIDAVLKAFDGNSHRAQHAAAVVKGTKTIITESEMFRLDTEYLMSSEEDRKELQ